MGIMWRMCEDVSPGTLRMIRVCWMRRRLSATHVSNSSAVAAMALRIVYAWSHTKSAIQTKRSNNNFEFQQIRTIVYDDCVITETVAHLNEAAE